MFSRHDFQRLLSQGGNSTFVIPAVVFAMCCQFSPTAFALDGDKLPRAFPKESSVARTAKNTETMAGQLGEMKELVEDVKDAAEALNENAYFTAQQNEVMATHLKSIASSAEKCEEEVLVLRVNSEEFLKRFDEITVLLRKNTENTERIGDGLNILNEQTAQVVRLLQKLASDEANKGKPAQSIKIEKKGDKQK
ncbi:hypothetical protein ACFL1X_00590 [Candidatus Hydrogenedentota bacterium]